jgi:transcriptional regulator with XRE-family HTH domain
VRKVGQNLKRIREERGLSVRELADISRLDKGTVSDLENFKKKGVDLDTILKLSKALEVKPYELIGDEPDPISPSDVMDFLADNFPRNNDEIRLIQAFRSSPQLLKLAVLGFLTDDETVWERFLELMQKSDEKERSVLQTKLKHAGQGDPV